MKGVVPIQKCRTIGFVAALGLCMYVLGGVGQAAKMGGFFEYTVYTKGRVPPAEYKQRVVVALHGFLSAMPNGNYYDIQNAMGEDYTVVGFNYDYLDVATNVTEFESFHQEFLTDRDVIVLGTSLGGFWADYFANQIGARGLIMINPVANPAERATANLGEHYSKKRDKTVMITEETVKAYGGLESENDSRVERLVLLTKDDEVLDYRIAEKRYGSFDNTEIVYFEQGGHRLDLTRPDVMPVIRAFIEARFAD